MIEGRTFRGVSNAITGSFIDQTASGDDMLIRGSALGLSAYFRDWKLLVVTILDPLTKNTLISAVGTLCAIAIVGAFIFCMVALFRGDMTVWIKSHASFSRPTMVDAACSAISIGGCKAAIDNKEVVSTPAVKSCTTATKAQLAKLIIDNNFSDLSYQKLMRHSRPELIEMSQGILE